MNPLIKVMLYGNNFVFSVRTYKAELLIERDD